MQKIIVLFVFFFLLMASAGYSQDKIYRKNGKVVEAKVLEISSTEVKYREFKNPDGPIYVLEADRISRIVFQDGKVQKFEEDLRDPEKYEGQLRKSVKIDFLGPLLGYSQISFEKSTGIGKGYELSLGVIGAGKSSRLEYYDTEFRSVRRNQFGFFVSGGYKFSKLPDFILFGKTRFSHVMQGTYLKPVVYFGHYKENRIEWKGNNTYEVGKQNITFGAIQLEAGKQWVFADKVLLDMFSGIGYAFDNKKDSYGYGFDNTSSYNYASARLGTSPGLGFTFGIRVGLLIK